MRLPKLELLVTLFQLYQAQIWFLKSHLLQGMLLQGVAGSLQPDLPKDLTKDPLGDSLLGVPFL